MIKTDLTEESMKDADSYIKKYLLQIYTIAKFHHWTNYQTTSLFFFLI